MSDATDDANRWSWVTPDGQTITGAKGELMLALRGERLPAGTLVWRAGWAEWLPASRVTELKSVLPPGKAEPAQAPKLAGAEVKPVTAKGAAPASVVKSQPPPAPTRQPGAKSQPPPAPVRQPGARSLPPPAPVRGGSSHPPPAPVRSKPELAAPVLPGPRVPTTAGAVVAAPGAQVRPRGASILGPPRDQMTNPAVTRAPMPTLGGEEGTDPRTTTLRPPGAVPPPPRVGGGPMLAMPASRIDDELPTQRHQPAPSRPGGRDDAQPPTELRPGIVMPTSTEAAATERGMPADLDATLGSTPFDSGRAPPSALSTTVPPSTTLESANPSAPVDPSPLEKHEVSWTVPMPRSVTIALVVFFAGLLLSGTGGLVFMSTHHFVPDALPDRSAAPPAAAPNLGPGCHLLTPAARLAATVERAAQPALAELVRGERVAVGFAPAPKAGGGLLVAIDTLDARRMPDQVGDAVVKGSVPLVKDGNATFAVDRVESELTGAHTLADGTTVGFAGTDLVRRAGTSKSVLFAGAASDKTTDPRVATSSAGTLITFRRGGLGGQVLYGWLANKGGVVGPLAPVVVPDVKLAGTPDAAADATGGVLAFAGRPSDKTDWRVQLVGVPLRGAPTPKTFVTPPGGSGGGNIAPAVTALGDDGWVLQWTEGAAGAYEVRVQRLDAKLEPVGDARLVSPKGANAGQGALLATGSRVLSVFIQTTAGHDELWGATFECH